MTALNLDEITRLAHQYRAPFLIRDTIPALVAEVRDLRHQLATAARERDEARAQLETVAAQLRQCIDERNHRIKERVAVEARLAAARRRAQAERPWCERCPENNVLDDADHRAWHARWDAERLGARAYASGGVVREGRYQVTQARALWFCIDCGAVVPIEARELHDAWHERVVLRVIRCGVAWEGDDHRCRREAGHAGAHLCGCGASR